MINAHFDNCIHNPNRDEKSIKEKKVEIEIKRKEQRESLPLLTCSHCNKESKNKFVMEAYHFDNCQKLTGTKPKRKLKNSK